MNVVLLVASSCFYLWGPRNKPLSVQNVGLVERHAMISSPNAGAKDQVVPKLLGTKLCEKG